MHLSQKDVHELRNKNAGGGANSCNSFSRELSVYREFYQVVYLILFHFKINLVKLVGTYSKLFGTLGDREDRMAPTLIIKIIKAKI